MRARSPNPNPNPSVQFEGFHLLQRSAFDLHAAAQIERKADHQMSQNEDLANLARALRKDLTDAQVKLTELVRQIAALPQQPDLSRKCPTCGITTRGPLSLAEHVHNSHSGPLPDHWRRAEQLAGLEETTA